MRYFQGCHAMFIDGYVGDGHVPVNMIRKMLSERPDIAGITLPGMPMGSPGMVGEKTETFTIYAVTLKDSRIGRHATETASSRRRHTTRAATPGTIRIGCCSTSRSADWQRPPTSRTTRRECPHLEGCCQTTTSSPRCPTSSHGGPESSSSAMTNSNRVYAERNR